MENRESESYLFLPLIDSLKHNPRAYGASSFKIPFENAVKEYAALGIPQIIAIEGEIGTGKTTLAGEVLRKTKAEFEKVGIDINKIAHIPFEGVQRETKEIFPSMKERKPGTYTVLDYIHTHFLFVRDIVDAVRKGSFIVIESAGLALRGDLTMYTLSRRMVRFASQKEDSEQPQYHIRAIFITASDEVLKNSDRIRSKYDEENANKVSILGEHDVVVFSTNENPEIGGGGMIGVKKFRDELVNALWQIYTDLPENKIPKHIKSKIKNKDDLYDNTKRMLFEEEVYSHLLFGEQLHMPPQDVFVGKNAIRQPIYHYQNDLDQFDITRQSPLF